MAVAGTATHRAGGATNDLFQQVQPQAYQPPSEPTSRITRQRVLSEQGVGSCAFGFSATANGVVPGVLTITRSIVAGSDDAMESPGASPILTEGNHYMDVIDDQMGMRFTDLPIQQGATISHAVVTQILPSAKNDAEGTWFGHDVDDSATFTTTDGDLTGRAHTTASVAWTTNDLGAPEDEAPSPDLAAILQEIVDRPGWQPGNNVSFIYVHNSTTDQFITAAHEDPVFPGAVLYVEYRPIPQVTGVADVFFGFEASATGDVSQTLTVADSSQDQAADTPTLTQVHNLTVADATQDQAVDAPVLTQTHTLAVAEATQAQTVDSPTLEVLGAFPSFSVGTPHSSGTGTTSREVAFGATLDANDGLLLVALYRDGLVTAPGGSWALIATQTQNNFELRAWLLPADGGESSLTLTTETGVQLIAYPIRITNWDHTTTPEATTDTFTADPPSESASWGANGNGWVAVNVNNGSGVTGYPTGFDDDQFNTSRAGDSLHTGLATKGDAVATLNPSTFTAGGSPTRNIVATIVVRGAAGGAIDLTVADADQVQAADSPVLTQTHVLAVADATQAQSVDTPALTQAHILAVSEGTQAQAAAGIALTQTHNLTVPDAVQAQTADTVATVVDLAIADAVQAQTTDGIALTQAHALAVADAAQGQVADSPNLTQAHALAVAAPAQEQGSDSPTLTQVHGLTVPDTGQDQAADSPALTQVHTLVIADTAQAQAADSPTIVVGGITLVVADAGQAQAVDSPALTQAHTLSATDATQAQSSDTPALTQAHTLAVSDASQVQTADSPTLTVDSINLAIADAAQSQTADSPTLTQAHTLVVADATQAQAADTPTLTVGSINLIVADATQAQAPDSPTLTQAHSLVVGDAAQDHTADSVALTQAHALTVEDVVQAHTVDTVALIVDLTVQDATHGQALDAITLTQGHVLAVSDALQQQTGDTLLLTQVHQLIVADDLLAQLADGLTLILGVIQTPTERTIPVAPETRSLTIATEDRTVIATEDRTVRVT